MKGRDEIYVLQDLATLAATLLNTGNHEAKDAAQPILAMIKSQFPSTAEASAPQAEDACNQFEAAGPNPHYDPVAAATERLRLAMLAFDEAKAKRDAHCEATEELEHEASKARRAKDKAQGDLLLAIEAANRA